MPNLNEINQKPPEFMKCVKSFVSNPRGFFLISGTNGNGKTFTARAIFSYLDNPIVDNIFYNVSKLNSKFTEMYNSFGSTNYLSKQLINAPLLVLDDLGATRDPPAGFKDFLYQIIDERWEHKPNFGTIITTNLTPDEIDEKFSRATLSRISSGICVRYDGPDRRRENKVFL